MKKNFGRLFHKVPILKYILSSFIKYFLAAVFITACLFAVLYFTGVYSMLESALDLKYNSPFVLVPMYAFAALAVLCLFIGFLLYFHKYKRSKSNTEFHKIVSVIMNDTQEMPKKVRGK